MEELDTFNVPENTIYDTLVYEDGTEKRVIIDFMNHKFIHFFDFTTKNPDHVLLICLWHSVRPDLRFSVFCTIYFKQYFHLIPSISIVNKKAIKEIKRNYPYQENKKARKKKIQVS